MDGVNSGLDSKTVQNEEYVKGGQGNEGEEIRTHVLPSNGEIWREEEENRCEDHICDTEL
jgi:hypothetical protein